MNCNDIWLADLTGWGDCGKKIAQTFECFTIESFIGSYWGFDINALFHQIWKQLGNFSARWFLSVPFQYISGPVMNRFAPVHTAVMAVPVNRFLILSWTAEFPNFIREDISSSSFHNPLWIFQWCCLADAHWLWCYTWIYRISLYVCLRLF